MGVEQQRTGPHTVAVRVSASWDVYEPVSVFSFPLLRRLLLKDRDSNFAVILLILVFTLANTSCCLKTNVFGI
jgi:hypothetical protein